jgi:rare lipoprotein A
MRTVWISTGGAGTRIRRVPCLLLALGLGGCAAQQGGYYGGDGPPPESPVQVAHVPDAVPRYETPSDSGNRPYAVAGRLYEPLATGRGYRERGVASWYGTKFHGRATSSGEPYDMYAMTAAHRTLPLPSYARVTNLRNQRSVVVRVNDRGPFHSDRVIDLSYAAAAKLGIAEHGTGLVEVVAVEASGSPSPAVSASGVPAGADPRLFVQVGAFAYRSNAEDLRTRLGGLAVGPVFIETVANALGPLHRVRVGPLESVAEGDRLAARIAALGIVGARLIVD